MAEMNIQTEKNKRTFEEFDLGEVERFKTLNNMEDLFRDIQLETIETPKSFGEIKASGAVDLRQYTTDVIEDQYDGYCTAYATMNAFEILANKEKNTRDHRFSQRYFFESCYKQFSLVAATNAAQRCPVPPYQCYRTDGSGDCRASLYAKTKAVGSVALGSRIDLWKYYLDQGLPLTMAAEMNRDWLKCNKAITGQSAAVKNSGHAVAVVGYNDAGRYFIIENSWGADCGDRGYQYYSYDLLDRSDLYHFAYAIPAIEQAKRITCYTDKVCKFKNFWRRSVNDEECTKCKEVN
jgi:hypothetical protein